MKEFLGSVKFKVLIFVLALLLGIMLYVATTGGEKSFATSFFGAILSPIQKASTSISNKVNKTLDMIINSDKYYEENEKLKEQLGEFYNQMVDYESLKEQNDNLREILDLKKEYDDYKFSPPCAIIGRTTNDVYQSFFIDKGSRDGISKNDPVITASGLVGIINDVELTYSRVTTILSPENPIGVYCIRTKETGIIEGTYELALDGLCKMKFINRDSELKKGDIIVTSGHSGLVPKDRVIGTVQEVYTEESGLSKVAIIIPIVDIENTTNVFVLTEFEGQGEGYEE